MANLVFVQGDTLPILRGAIHKQGDSSSPTDLTHATGVKFQMRKTEDIRYTVDAAAVVVNAAQGLVTYSWAAGDLSAPGDYQTQWEVTFSDGKVQTTATPVVITVRRQ